MDLGMPKCIKIDSDGRKWISISEVARRLGTTTTVVKKLVGEQDVEFMNFSNGKTIYIPWANFVQMTKDR